MGLPGFWLEMAREIGFDRFIQLWRRLDREASMRADTDSMILVQLRRFSSYERYQRNRFIETLADLGLSRDEIRSRVQQDLGEELSDRHILRLSSRRRVQP